MKKYLKYINPFFVSGFDSGYLKGYKKALRRNLIKRNELQKEAIESIKKSFSETGNLFNSFISVANIEVHNCKCCKNIITDKFMIASKDLEIDNTKMCPRCFAERVLDYFNKNDCNYIFDEVFKVEDDVKLKVVK